VEAAASDVEEDASKNEAEAVESPEARRFFGRSTGINWWDLDQEKKWDKTGNCHENSRNRDLKRLETRQNWRPKVINKIQT